MCDIPPQHRPPCAGMCDIPPQLRPPCAAGMPAGLVSEAYMVYTICMLGPLLETLTLALTYEVKMTAIPLIVGLHTEVFGAWLVRLGGVVGLPRSTLRGGMWLLLLLSPSSLVPVCVWWVVALLAAQPLLAKWIRWCQPAHTPPQRPPGAEGKGRHKDQKGLRLERERRREN
eukprot:360178-Chlamydomonas_euryale.AAC.8